MFDMGEHAIYVWSSYIVVLVVLAINLLGPVLRHRRLLAMFARRLHKDNKQ